VSFENATLKVRRTVDYIAKLGFVENETKTTAGERLLLMPSLVVETLKDQHTQLKVLRHGSNQLDSSQQTSTTVVIEREVW
jgi:hypothetical protein